MTKSIKAAMTALGGMMSLQLTDNCVTLAEHAPVEIALICAALEGAQQEADRYAECESLLLAAQRLYQDQAKEIEAAQQDMESIEAYGRAHPASGPSIFFYDNKWRGYITEQLMSLCQGDSYAEVHSKLAAWCKQGLAK